MRLGGREAERGYEALMRASEAYASGRERDAVRILRPLRRRLPGAAAVRELYGLSLYRMGRYAEAVGELAAFAGMTGGTEAHPVLMDCHRALGEPDQVEQLWEELAAASPSPELVTEGRIVRAATRADAGRLDEALALLRRSAAGVRRPRDHHLRLWYVVGDLEERAGDLTAARTWFARVRDQDPSFADVAQRLAALG